MCLDPVNTNWSQLVVNGVSVLSDELACHDAYTSLMYQTQSLVPIKTHLGKNKKNWDSPFFKCSSKISPLTSIE